MSRYLITSALPYINGVKHLGNLVGSMLPADAYARFQRARGREVLFICATDEHGTPAELAAHEAGLPVAEYCAKMHVLQKDLDFLSILSADLTLRKITKSPSIFTTSSTRTASWRNGRPARSILSTTAASSRTATSSAPATIAATSGRAAINARIARASWIRPT
jgi:leucyl-tRNA synthetase